MLMLGRLYPLHFFVLICLLPITFVKFVIFQYFGFGTNPIDENNITTFFLNVFLIHSLGLLDFVSWNHPSWSISVEFYVYLIFYLFIRFTKLNHILLLSLVISIVSYSTLWPLTENYNSLLVIMIMDLRGLGGFFLGVSIHAVRFHKKLKYNNFLLQTFFEITVIVVAIAVILNSDDNRLYQLLAFLVFGLIMIIFSLKIKGIVGLLFETKIFTFLGKISYSIYMTHFIICVVARNIAQYIFHLSPVNVDDSNLLNTQYFLVWDMIILALVICTSFCTYSFIEVPARNYVKENLYKNPVNYN